MLRLIGYSRYEYVGQQMTFFLDFRLNILDSFIVYISSQHLGISLTKN